MKRLIIVLILLFPVVSLAWFCYWGFTQPKKTPPLSPSTNTIVANTNLVSTTNQPR